MSAIDSPMLPGYLESLQDARFARGAVCSTMLLIGLLTAAFRFAEWRGVATMASRRLVIAFSLLCALCAADGSGLAERAGPGVLPRSTAAGAIADGVGADDVSEVWSWTGSQGDVEARLHAAVPIRYFAYDPYVVDAETTAPVLLSVYAESTVTNLWVELQAGGTVTPTVIEPDAYQFTFTATEALHDYDPLYYRSFVGYLYIDTIYGSAGRLNLFIDVLNDDVPSVTPITLAPDAQAAGHVVNLLAPAATPGSYDPSIFHRLYGLYPDAFDFVNVVWVDNRVQNRTHASISNHIQGIGRVLFDNSAEYGSAGRLQGINIFPISSFFDGASIGFQHETGHQWINWVLPGIPHWPISEMAQGIMGYNIPGSGGVGGHFPWRFTTNPDGTYTLYKYGEHLWEVGFCDLDLYLMGLLPADEVGPALVFENQDQQLCDGCVLQGPVYYADATTIADAHGPRVPDASAAPSQFTVGTIVVTRDRLLTAQELAFFDFMAGRASATEVVHVSEGFGAGPAKPWFLNTRTLSTLYTDMVPLSTTPTPTRTPTHTVTPTFTPTPTATPAGTCTPQPPEELLDQSQTGRDYGYWFEASVVRWQEFMPALENLTAVEVSVGRTGNPGDVEVEIKAVDGTRLRRAIVHQADVGNGWLRVEFCPAIVLVPGTKYRICVASDQPSPSPEHRYVWRGSSDSSYNPECASDVSHLMPEFDYAFRTYAIGGASATPTPTLPAVLPAPRLYSIVNDDGDGSYLVDWSSVDGATLYVLQEDDSEHFPQPLEAYRGMYTLASLQGRAPGTYYYRTKASDGLHESDWSNVMSVIVTQGVATLTQTPTPSLTPTLTGTPRVTATPAAVVYLPFLVKAPE
jgi:hypothetical protein